MAKIFAPNKAYNGETASVHFANGVGETERPELIDWFREHSYKVVEPENAPEEKKTDESEKALDDMIVPELKAYAVEKGIDLAGLTKREDILTKITGGQ